MRAFTTFPAFLVLSALAAGVEQTAAAQWLPPSEWGEPTIIDLDHPPPAAEANPEEQPGPIVLDPSTAPAPFTQEEAAALNETAVRATYSLVAVTHRGEMFFPEDVENQGVATRIQVDDQDPVYLSSLFWLQGVDEVYFEGPDGRVRALVRGDARFGLVLLTPVTPLPPSEALALSDAGADTQAEVFTTEGPFAGGTLGAGEGDFAYYQISSLPVTVGHPLIDRNGALIGIGSHPYPSDPALSLSIPAGEVRRFVAEEAGIW